MTINKIKSTSLELFALKGYEGTSISDIAKAVGLQKSSIYTHFNSKEELFLTIFNEVINDFISDIEKLSSQIKHYSVKEKLYAIFYYFCESYKIRKYKNLFLNRAMIFPPISSENLKTKYMTYEQTNNKILIPIFEEGVKSGIIKDNKPKELIAAFYCLVDGFFIESHYYVEQEYKSRINLVWNIFWTGITNNA